MIPGCRYSRFSERLRSLNERGVIERQGHRMRLTDPTMDVGQMCILVYGNVVQITGNAAAAITLSQLLYWSDANRRGQCRLRVQRRGHYWTAKCHEDLAAETGLTVRTVRSALGRLNKRGLIVMAHFMFSGRRTLHLRIENDVLAQAWSTIVLNTSSEDPADEPQSPAARQADFGSLRSMLS